MECEERQSKTLAEKLGMNEIEVSSEIIRKNPLFMNYNTTKQNKNIGKFQKKCFDIHEIIESIHNYENIPENESFNQYLCSTRMESQNSKELVKKIEQKLKENNINNWILYIPSDNGGKFFNIYEDNNSKLYFLYPIIENVFIHIPFMEYINSNPEHQHFLRIGTSETLSSNSQNYSDITDFLNKHEELSKACSSM